MESRIGNGGAEMNFRLLNKKQMAAEMGVSYRTITRWMGTGYLRKIPIGGRIYFSYAEVERIRDRYLEGHQRDSQIRYVGDILDKYQSRLADAR